MTVRELLRRMTSAEITEQRAYDQLRAEELKRDTP
jgi:hypothetical protein